tara:strand:+ start:302 stop:589 length:288 start_codon:yes stop_codon:yes gene_type:complete
MQNEAFLKQQQMNMEKNQEMKDAVGQPQNTAVNITGPTPPMNPYSNGTGSGRPNIDPVNANNINQMNQGNPMGQQMFGPSKKNPLTVDMFFTPKQ